MIDFDLKVELELIWIKDDDMKCDLQILSLTKLNLTSII
jgi:hypothetical protein